MGACSKAHGDKASFVCAVDCHLPVLGHFKVTMAGTAASVHASTAPHMLAAILPTAATIALNHRRVLRGGMVLILLLSLGLWPDHWLLSVL